MNFTIFSFQINSEFKQTQAEWTADGEVIEVVEVTVGVTTHGPIFHSTKRAELRRILKKEAGGAEDPEIKADLNPGFDSILSFFTPSPGHLKH